MLGGRRTIENKELYYWVGKVGSSISHSHANVGFGKRHPNQKWHKFKTYQEAKAYAEKLRKQK